MSEPILNGKPVPGLYRGVSMATYESIPALRWSRLGEYLKSPAHGKAAESSFEDKDYLTIGQAFHTAVLEPSEWNNRFGTVPDDAPTKRSNEGKRWWAEFEAANSGRTFLKPEAFYGVRSMAEAVYAHPTANALLTAPGNAREVVCVWMDPVSGLFCKCRIDLVTKLGGLSYIIDLKSAKDASPYGFARDLGTYCYTGQLAFYRQGLNAVAPFDRSVGFIVCEKDPITVTFYTLGAASQEQGDFDVRRAISTFVEADTAQKWPGYADGEIDLPSWKLRS